jgi:hypothetical protein
MSTLLSSDREVGGSDRFGFHMFSWVPCVAGPGIQFESHFGRSVFAGQWPVSSSGVDKTAQVLTAAYRFLCRSAHLHPAY